MGKIISVSLVIIIINIGYLNWKKKLVWMFWLCVLWSLITSDWFWFELIKNKYLFFLFLVFGLGKNHTLINDNRYNMNLIDKFIFGKKSHVSFWSSLKKKDYCLLHKQNKGVMVIWYFQWWWWLVFFFNNQACYLTGKWWCFRGKKYQ